MFTLKIYSPDGSYTSVACKTFRVTPGKDGDKTLIEVRPFDGEPYYLNPDPHVIVENQAGKTIDVIRQKRGA